MSGGSPSALIFAARYDTSTDRGALDSPRQFYPATLQVGKRWVSSFVQRQSGGVQRFRYDVRVTAKENVMLGVARVFPHATEAERRDTVGYYLNRVGLGSAMNKHASELSSALHASSSSLTASTLTPRLAFSSSVRLISITSSAPPAPITTGTPT